jgi:preprotein translocase subunit YajC
MSDLASPNARLALLTLALARYATASLPYNPTTILISPQDRRFAYIFQPSPQTSQFLFGSLDLSAGITRSTLSVKTIQATLPFLGDSTVQPFSVAIDQNGTIAIYVGNCSEDASLAQLWKYQTALPQSARSWAQLAATGVGVSSQPPGFLSSAVTFASNTSTTMTQSKMYVFGGMCPSTSAITSWIQSSSYTDTVDKITLPQNSSQYSLDVSSARSPPVPQAGQSLTPLLPTYSTNSDGTQAAQQSFLLLGGHTSSAFMNVSQLALFSLPQEAWTYISTSASASISTALEPRSGHSAVLSSDGSKVVIFGGWVGEVTTPSTPQMAVLNVADGYGGSGDWSWSLPSPSGTGPPVGTGLYGHGAVMLPGNVMLVTGGYSIQPASTRRKRSNTQPANSNTYLYNVSSNSWITEYNAPLSAFSTSTAQPHRGALSTPSQKAGLGVGIVLLVALLFFTLFFWLWYKRRQRWRREQREDEMRGAQGFVSDEWGVYSYTNAEKFAGSETLPYAPSTRRAGDGQGSQSQQRPPMAEKQPPRVLRKPVGIRGPYPYERSVRGREQIHPIAERDEDEAAAEADGETPATDTIRPVSDPFHDRHSPRPADGHAQQATQAAVIAASTAARETEIQSWIAGWKRAGEELLGEPAGYQAGPPPSPSHGRVSPAKSDDRTLSSLSSASARSSRSGGGVSGIVRTLSTRSAALLRHGLAAPFVAGSHAGSAAAASSAGGAPSSRGSDSVASSEPTVAIQTATATRLFHAAAGTLAATAVSTPAAAASVSGELRPGRTRPRETPAARGWMGSVRRAMGMHAAPGGAPPSPLSPAGRSSSMTSTGGADGYSPAAVGMSTAMASAAGASGLAPRRAASDAEFWAGKRGARDWGGGSSSSADPAVGVRRGPGEGSGPGEGAEAAGGAEEDGEWDVEGAARGRVVQLMFTVPRERLRVVNADVDGRSVASGAAEDDDAGDHEHDTPDDATW